MIKELNYYLTTNRFSQIAEDIDKSVREYASSFGNNITGDVNLREKTRLLCEEQLILSGIRTNEDSFINIDAEFFEGGELVEANLNRFIKDVLKAHGYQKILWEYMGTTGLMTEVSKSAMENDGFSYDKFLPVTLQQKEKEKKSNKITRNFNKLKDESGFNWNQSYDPNYSVTKKGWTGAFDNENVWNYYKLSEVSSGTKSNNNEVYSIKIIKIENGCMLFDSDEILLNPVILWFLTREDEIYGSEESNTAKIVEEIREQMKFLDVKSITEIAVSEPSTKNTKTKLEEYTKILGKLADSKIKFVSKEQAEKQIISNQQNEKAAIVQQKSVELQNKIDVIKSANPEISSEKLIDALETGKTEVTLDITNYNDAIKAKFTDEEYHQIKDLVKSLKASKKQDFIKACTVISNSWENYKSCGKEKSECINLIYNYLTKNEVSTFSYEKYLKDILVAVEDNSTNEISSDEIVKLIENNLPEENKEFAKEYILSLPEQKNEIRNKVFNSLQNAIKNYLVIRSSTGMSIKELFNYAIKSSGGTLPKSEITPPTIGYITPGMQAKVDEGNKRIFFESSVDNLFTELVNSPLPTKEVSISELEKAFEESKKEKPVLVLGSKKENSEDKMIYDSDDEDKINPLVLSILKALSIKTSSIKNSVSKSKNNINEIREKVLAIAKSCDTEEKFISALKKECDIEYNFTDNVARNIFIQTNKSVSEDYLTECANSIEEEVQNQILSKEYIMGSISNIKPVFSQVDISETTTEQNKVKLPEGYSLFQAKAETSKGIEQVNVIQTRLNPVLAVDNKAATIEQKTGDVGALENTILSYIENTLNKNQKEELLYICNDDLSIITPLLVKEYLWRKENGKNVKNIVEDIQALQNINKIPQEEFERYTEAQNIIMPIEGKAFDFENNSTGIDLNVANVVRVESDKSTKLKNKISLTPTEREHFKMNYGLPTEGLSPVIKEYIQSGEWKNNRFGNVDGINSNENHSYEDVISGNGNKNGEMKSSTIKVSNNKTEHINVDEPYSMSPELKETFKEVSRSRKSTSKTDSSSRKEYTDSPINAFTNSMSPDEIKMARINANYEHDKAALAKSDPVFAKNQFWDVGHAENEKQNVKADEIEVKKNTNWFEEEINKKLNKEIKF